MVLEVVPVVLVRRGGCPARAIHLHVLVLAAINHRVDERSVNVY